LQHGNGFVIAVFSLDGYDDVPRLKRGVVVIRFLFWNTEPDEGTCKPDRRRACRRAAEDRCQRSPSDGGPDRGQESGKDPHPPEGSDARSSGDPGGGSRCHMRALVVDAASTFDVFAVPASNADLVLTEAKFSQLVDSLLCLLATFKHANSSRAFLVTFGLHDISLFLGLLAPWNRGIQAGA